MIAVSLFLEENRVLYHFALIMAVLLAIGCTWALVGSVRLLKRPITPNFETLQRAKKSRFGIAFLLYASLGGVVQAIYTREYLMLVPAFMLFCIASPLMVLYYKHRKAVPPAEPANNAHNG